jgi:hypothetical protein
VGTTAAIEREGVFRIELERLAVVGDGMIKVALSFVGTAAVVERDGEFRIEPDRLAVIRDGAIVVAPSATSMRCLRVWSNCESARSL